MNINNKTCFKELRPDWNPTMSLTSNTIMYIAINDHFETCCTIELSKQKNFSGY